MPTKREEKKTKHDLGLIIPSVKEEVLTKWRRARQPKPAAWPGLSINWAEKPQGEGCLDSPGLGERQPSPAVSTLQNWAPEQRGDLSARWEWHHGLLVQTQHTGQRPEAPKGSRSWVVLKLQKETILGYRISQPPSHNRGRDQKAAKPSWGIGAAHLSYLHLGATSFFFLPFF